jgi:DNA polymerase eta
VEQRRLGIHRDVPVAVQQWDGLIAVNYAARANGITRHMRSAEAKAKCPDLMLVHVETIGEKGQSDSSIKSSENAVDMHSRLTQKACLARYRRASGEILALLHRLLPSTSTIEKASIDEVYVDVTDQVEEGVKHVLSGTNDDATSSFPWGAIVLGGPLQSGSEFDVRLASGAGIACRIRGALLEELGFTASAGISFNKVLAKIGSGLNKPNQMTVIPIRAVQQLMASLPLRKVPGFGGKVGDELQALGCETAGDVGDVPMRSLIELFGPEKAQSILNTVQGKTMDKVLARERPKSMLAAKSFSATSDMKDLRQWINILSGELAERMLEDEELFNRRAKTLVVHFKSVGNPRGSDHSRRGPMPNIRQQVQRPLNGPEGGPIIAAAAWTLFKNKCLPDALPCCRLALSAVDFEEGIVTGAASSGKGSITNFLKTHNVEKNLGRKRREEQEEAPSLQDVDIDEQRRLLKEASMLHTLKRKPNGRVADTKKAGHQQTNIGRYFKSK